MAVLIMAGWSLSGSRELRWKWTRTALILQGKGFGRRLDVTFGKLLTVEA